MSLSGIYKIVNKETGFFYIGSSRSLDYRRRAHFSLLNRNKHTNSYLQRVYNKYGSGVLEFSVVLRCPPEYLIKLEQWCIDNLKPEYNLCKVAGTSQGKCLSEEVRKKMSLSRRGKIHTQETKNKIGLAHKGKKMSELSKIRMRTSAIGRNNEVLIKRLKSTSRVGSLNGRATLTEEVVKSIKQDVNLGLTNKIIRDKYQVKTHILDNIKAGKTWKHVIV